MNGSYRKRKSMWDMKEDSFPPSEISENNAWKSKDNRSRLSDLEADDELQRKDSRWPSSEPSQGHNSNSRRGNNIGKDRHEFPENPRSWGGDDRYRRSISPGYDGRGQQNRSRSPENTWNQSYRGRDRMGNRSRARDGSLSRSGSQSRSRSRSWSRSPLRGGGGDRRRESYGMSDRRCGSGQPCREHAMGKCRRGSQCRFLHQDRQVDNDLSERGALKYGNSKGPRDNSYDRGNRNPNPSFDHEQRRPHTKILCKFFQIGKCQRQDCRFSHEGPTSGNREERPRWGRESEDTKKSWNGPSWDDVAGGSNFAKLSGWGGDNSVSNMNSSDPRTDEKQSNDDKWGHTLGGSPAWQDKSALEDRYHDNSQGNREINNVGSNEFSGMRREDSSHHQPQTDVPENSYMNENRGHKMDEYMVADGSSELNTAHSLPLTGQSFSRSINSTGTVSPSKSFGVTDQNRQFLYRSPSNGHNIIDSKGSLQEGFSPLSPQNPTQSQIYHQEEAKMQTPVEYEVPLATNEAQQSILTSEQLAQIATLPASLSQRFGNGQLLSQLYAVSEPDPVPVPPVVVMDDPVARSQVQYNTTGNDGGEPLLQSSGGGLDNESGKINQTGDPANENQEPNQNQEVKENNNVGAEKTKEDRENMVSGNGDEKGMRLFKGALVEFVKDILKPTWKEGKMSREVHKTIVKKVVDKVTGSVQGVNIPKTQEKIDQYLSFSKPKITKLVQAYVERLLKN